MLAKTKSKPYPKVSALMWIISKLFKLIYDSLTLHYICNIPHRKKSVQSQGILRQLVPNLVGRVLGPVGCQEQNREAWMPGWAES
jgi:hypothetical protein